MAYTTTIALILVISVPSTVTLSCPSECTCLPHLTKVDCNDRQLTLIPQNIPENTIELHLDNNRISHIANGTFQRLISLRYLYMSNNNIAVIERGAFFELQSLESLDISSNDIATITNGTFDRLTNLVRLYLYQNKITVIQPGLFIALRSLDELYIYSNHVSHIANETFAGLTRLRYLHLSKNGISFIKPGAFNGLQSLESLDMDTNYISHIENGTFDGLTNMMTLYLYQNNITVIQPGLFRDLRSLEELYLYDNDIRYIANETFVGLTNLRILHLSNNDIAVIEQYAFNKLQNLDSLDLSFNDVSYISNKTFMGLRNLQSIDLYGNKLTTLPVGVFQSPPLGIAIKLDNNPWNCDCNIRWLQHLLLNTTYIITTATSGVHSGIICEAPSVHASKLVIDIQPQQLVCPPIIQTDEEEIHLEITSGLWVEMVCPVIGDPYPSISWLTADLVGSQANIPSSYMTHSNGSLTIGSVSESDAGNYKCTATNYVGSDQLVYHLSVVEKSDRGTVPTNPYPILPIGTVSPKLELPVDTTIPNRVVPPIDSADPNPILLISLGVLGLFLIIGSLVFIVIKLKKRNDNAEGIDWYDDCITTPPGAQQEEVTTDQEILQHHYNTIDDDAVIRNTTPEHIAIEQIRRNLNPPESEVVYETRIT